MKKKPGKEKHWLERELDDYDSEVGEIDSAARDNVTNFRASLAHHCPRTLWYYRKGYKEEPPTSQGRRRMNIGTLYHDFIDAKFRGKGLLVSAEEDVIFDDPPILGHYDAVVKHPGTGEDHLIELKSYAQPKPNSRFRLKLPKIEHIGQWNLYAAYLKIKQGNIFYINKNDQSYKIYDQIFKPKLVEGIFKKLRMVQRALDNDERIPYQPNENHDWCPFKTQCERDWFIRGE